jgi:glycosyltransferase involved in cell wall biosynthesis
MPPITAILHTANDALRLGRCLETLLPCNEILIVDDFSFDSTNRVANRYGAHFIRADGQTASDYARLATNAWILCLDPSESLSEGLQASLFEWGLLRAEEVLTSGFNIPAREQIGEVWQRRAIPETRLVRRTWTRWNGCYPALDPEAPTLEGDLLKIAWP